MPIRFACACGRSLQARDEFAGRKIRCAGCGKVVVIPAGQGSAPLARHARPTKGATIPVLTKPAPRPEPMSAASPRKNQDTLQEQHATAWQPGAKRRFGDGEMPERSNWLGLALLVLVLAGLVGASWYFGKELVTVVQRGRPPRIKLAPELDMVPRDCVFFASVRVAELAKKFPPATSLAAQAEPQLKSIGIAFKQLERVTVVIPRLPPSENRNTTAVAMVPNTWFLISSKSSFQQNTILYKLGGTMQKHQGREYATLTYPAGRALRFLNERVMLLTSEAAMRHFLEHATAARTGAMGDSVVAAAKHSLVIASQLQPEHFENSRLGAYLRPLRLTTFALENNATDWEISWQFLFSDADSARQAEPTLCANPVEALNCLLPDMSKPAAAAAFQDRPLQKKRGDLLEWRLNTSGFILGPYFTLPTFSPPQKKGR